MPHMQGQCHCGSMSFDLESSLSPDTLSLRCCSCSFCKKHKAVWTSDSSGHVVIRVKSEQNLSRYQFGTATADFLICKGCGNVAVAIDETENGLKAVINTNLFDTVEEISSTVGTVSHDNETTKDRRSRRAKNWTPATLEILDI